MKEEIIIAGFGGQGVLSRGRNFGILGLMERQRGYTDAGLRPEQPRRYGKRNRDCK